MGTHARAAVGRGGEVPQASWETESLVAPPTAFPGILGQDGSGS